LAALAALLVSWGVMSQPRSTGAPLASPAADAGVSWNTYLGGDGGDALADVARNDAGEVFIVGTVEGAQGFGLPAGSGSAGSLEGKNILIARFQADGGLDKALLVGGNDDDVGTALALGGNGQLYVVGSSRSTDLLSLGTYGGWDGLLLQVDQASFSFRVGRLGGSGDDELHSVAVLPDGGFVIAGQTRSDSLSGVPIGSPRLEDAFVARLHSAPSGNPFPLDALVVLRGAQTDVASSVAVSSGGKVYVTGWTGSNDLFPGPSERAPAAGGGRDIFVASVELPPDGGTRIERSTYLGGLGQDEAHALLLGEGSPSVIVAGTTRSEGLAQAGAGAVSSSNAFVVTLDGDSLAVTGESVIGGTADDEGRALTLEGGLLYLGGKTASRDFPLAGGDAAFGDGGTQGFVARVDIGASPVVPWASFVGGGAEDEVVALRGDGLGHLLVGGTTSSEDLFAGDAPGFDRQFGGGGDLFLMRWMPPDAGPPGAGGADGGAPDAGPGGGEGELVSPVGWSCSASGGTDILALGALLVLVSRTVRRHPGASRPRG
jgi:hypothetical protein